MAKSALDADAIHVLEMESRVASLAADGDGQTFLERIVIQRERETAATEVTR